MDAGLVSGDIYIHSQPAWVYRGRILTSHWLGAVWSMMQGSKVTLLICAQVMLTRRPVLLSGTIVGDRWQSLSSAESLPAFHTTHTRAHTHTHTHTHTELVLQLSRSKFYFYFSFILPLSPVSRCSSLSFAFIFSLSFFWSSVQPVEAFEPRVCNVLTAGVASISLLFRQATVGHSFAYCIHIQIQPHIHTPVICTHAFVHAQWNVCTLTKYCLFWKASDGRYHVITFLYANAFTVCVLITDVTGGSVLSHGSLTPVALWSL